MAPFLANLSQGQTLRIYEVECVARRARQTVDAPPLSGCEWFRTVGEPGIGAHVHYPTLRTPCSSCAERGRNCRHCTPAHAFFNSHA
jgi:hypothetical protein